MLLVTGGAGFIGSNLVAALAARGCEVAVCDWMRSDERWRNIAKHEIADLVAPEDLRNWLAKAPCLEAVFHMGANSSTTETDIDDIAGKNIRATLALLEWCTESATPLIYASSAATYGDGRAGFDDDASPQALARHRPLNAYGWSKHVIDRRVARLAEAGRKMPPQWVGLKFFNVYGPNEYHKATMKSVVAQNYPRVAAGEPMRLFKSGRPDYPDGGQLRDFIYVSDCVDVMLWLFDHREVSGLFNLGTGEARTWLDLAHALFAAAGMEPRIEYIPMPEAIAPKYQYFTQAKMEKLRAAGYTPAFTALEDGVGDYVRNFLMADDPYR
jgi:ADP-L-glycero-D-manno-heptose 6-epimerase